jgi:hypothetical protein
VREVKIDSRVNSSSGLPAKPLVTEARGPKPSLMAAQVSLFSGSFIDSVSGASM